MPVAPGTAKPRVQVPLRVSVEVRDEILVYARKRGISQNTALLELVTRSLQMEGPAPHPTATDPSSPASRTVERDDATG